MAAYIGFRNTSSMFLLLVNSHYSQPNLNDFRHILSTGLKWQLHLFFFIAFDIIQLSYYFCFFLISNGLNQIYYISHIR